jgi:syntenin-1
MSLYPTLEDMKVGSMLQAQAQYSPAPVYQQQPASAPTDPARYPSMPPAYQSGDFTAAAVPAPNYTGGGAGQQLYPTVDDYMGLSLQTYTAPQQTISSDVAHRRDTRLASMCAPVSGSNLPAIQRSVIRPGVTEVVLCKDDKGLVGIRVREVNKGCFVQYVAKGSIAAMAGLRFGDQLLSINDELVAGYSPDKVHKILKKCPVNNIRIAVRERPFERVVTLAKDSGGITGLGFKDGKISEIIKDSSAARNGLLVDHQIIEINGVNVIGIKDSKLKEMLVDGGKVITLTIMPTFVYEHMVKQMGSSLFKSMDHSVPEC